MKNKFLHGAAALALCAGFVACSEYDAGVAPETLADIKSLQYETAFVQKFGKIDPAQDWGFGSGLETRAVTRAAATWDGVHSGCKFDETKFQFTVPSTAVNLAQGSFTDEEKSATEFYIDIDGELDFGWAFTIPSGAKIYNTGKLTSFNDFGISGTVTFYNLNEMTYNISSGERHTVINTADAKLTVIDYSNIGDVYNKGTLILERGHSKWWPNEVGTADIPNEMHIYSDGEGFVTMPDGGDLKAVCDIHSTLYVGSATTDDNKNVNIQNSTEKYICGIVATGNIQNTDGRLETSYMKADDIYFEGNHLYLLPGAHIEAQTIEFDKAACDVHAAENSNALVEATENISFKNENDFTRTFSSNIYFKIDGTISLIGQTGGVFTDDDRRLYSDAEDYIKNHGNPNDHLNAGAATGTPECGSTWTIGTPSKTKQIVLERRVFCEDLGSIGDFDFNDVVFDVTIYDDKSVDIEVLAAGGTLYIEVEGRSIHTDLGMPYMVNTIVGGAKCDPVVIKTTTTADVNDTNALLQYIKGIEIKVYQTNPQDANDIEGIVLTAEQGKAPQKICVPKDTRWMQEYERINDGYTKFTEWVKGGNNAPSLEDTFSESNANSSLLY